MTVTLAAHSPPAFAPLGTGCAGPAAPRRAPPPSRPFPAASALGRRGIRRDSAPTNSRRRPGSRARPLGAESPGAPGSLAALGRLARGPGSAGGAPGERATPASRGQRAPGVSACPGSRAPTRLASSNGRAAPGLGIPACPTPTSPRVPAKLDGVWEQWGGEGAFALCGFECEPWLLAKIREAGGISGRGV